MAFIRPKRINNTIYYYLVETVKKRQKVRRYLGKEIPIPLLGLFRQRKL